MNMKLIAASMLAGVVAVGCGAKEDQKDAKSDKAETASVAAEKQNESKAEDVMAVSVNGEKLMQSAIDADVATIVKAQGDKIPADRLEFAKQQIANQVVQSFLVENVLVAKAKEAKLVVTDEDRKAREDEILKAVSRMPDAPKTIDEYYKKFPLGEERARAELENYVLIDKLIKAEQAKAAKKDYKAEAQKIIDNIVSNNASAVAAEADALKKIKELKAKLDKVPAASLTNEFAKLAKENSACPSSQKGGDLGEFTHGQMVKEFDEVAFKMPVNKVSDPVKTQFGYHLLLVTKKIPAVEAKGDVPASPEKVQASHILIKTGNKQEVPKIEDVVKYLEKQGQRSFTQEFIQKQMSAAKIEASEAYKRFLPPREESEAPVEKPTKK